MQVTGVRTLMGAAPCSTQGAACPAHRKRLARHRKAGATVSLRIELWKYPAISVGLVTIMAGGTWWLLAEGTRGAEVANVLALPIAVVGALIALVGLFGTKRPSSRAGAPPTAPPVGRASGREAIPDAPISVRALPRPGRAMTTELFFLAGHPAALHQVAAELRCAGYLVREQPQDLGHCWSLIAHSAASELREEDRAELGKIAQRCDAIFDGTGTYVGPPEYNDGPGHRQRRRSD